MSLGGSGSCNALYRDAITQINALGVTIVASAGNGRGQAVSEPANCPGVIGVGGVRHEGDKVGYSDIGPELSLSAPAGNCVNTGASDPCLYPILTTANAGSFDPVTNAAGGSIYTDAFFATIGTSFSAPLVAGTAALMLSVNPNLSPAQVRQLLMSTSSAFPVYNDIPNCRAPNGSFQDQCNCTTSTCGAGMLDASAAVLAAAGGSGGGGGGGGGGNSGGGGGGGALGLGWLAALAVAVFALRRPRRGAPSA
ncbi:S8 family serine peptidase [Piscinibacter aquaticus]|uniref:S8 family serine peptidase n=1 Tax=Piscinibacter aquaticus TaxID=392597 RepID=A0A5C6U5G6_9BURK|nr:S8 family serine peptidase [Piscinibacter aquaticus]